MLASGNGAPEQCADNLLRTVRFSVPYERIKGIDGALIDTPSNIGIPEMEADAEWVLETYEPRVRVNGVKAGVTEGVGAFGIVADISINFEEANE